MEGCFRVRFQTTLSTRAYSLEFYQIADKYCYSPEKIFIPIIELTL